MSPGNENEGGYAAELEMTKIFKKPTFKRRATADMAVAKLATPSARDPLAYAAALSIIG